MWGQIKKEYFWPSMFKMWLYWRERSKEYKKVVDDQELDESILAFEGNEGEESYSTIKMECKKCGHDEAVWWMFQTRSADEPTTRFYRCSKCRYTWRDYS